MITLIQLIRYSWQSTLYTILSLVEDKYHNKIQGCISSQGHIHTIKVTYLNPQIKIDHDTFEINN
jgi:hypothetical protein